MISNSLLCFMLLHLIEASMCHSDCNIKTIQNGIVAHAVQISNIKITQNGIVTHAAQTSNIKTTQNDTVTPVSQTSNTKTTQNCMVTPVSQISNIKTTQNGTVTPVFQTSNIKTTQNCTATHVSQISNIKTTPNVTVTPFAQMGKNSTSIKNDTNTYKFDVETPLASVLYSKGNHNSVNNTHVNPTMNTFSDNSIKFLSPEFFKDAILDVNIPVKIDKLVNLANSVSPSQLQEKFFESSLLENIFNEIEIKSKDLKNVKSNDEVLLNNIRKRNAEWNETDPKTVYDLNSEKIFGGNSKNEAVSLIHNPLHPINNKMIHDIPKFFDFVYEPEVTNKMNDIVRSSHLHRRLPQFLPPLPHLPHQLPPSLPIHHYSLPHHHLLPPHHFHPRLAPLLLSPTRILHSIPRLDPILLLLFLRALSNPQFIQLLTLLNPIHFYQNVPSTGFQHQISKLSTIYQPHEESDLANEVEDKLLNAVSPFSYYYLEDENELPYFPPATNQMTDQFHSKSQQQHSEYEDLLKKSILPILNTFR
ncbi:hypothetical protein PGB90_003183 [Kerria lacca]